MLMKKIPYNLKKLGLIGALAVMPVFTSCEKDEPVDPKQERIKELTALEKVQAKAVRDAVKPAITQPEDIEGFYWETFANGNIPKSVNLLDSANVHIRVIDAVRGVYGVPIPFNNATLSDLYNKSKTYIVTATELNNLKQK